MPMKWTEDGWVDCGPYEDWWVEKGWLSTIVVTIGRRLSDIAWVLMIGFWLMGAAILVGLAAAGLVLGGWRLID